MKVDIIAIGNSKGVRIPKALLEQCGINGSVDLTVEDNKLVMRPIRKVREGWEEAAKRCHENGDDMTEELIEWRSFPNKFDEDEWEW